MSIRADRYQCGAKSGAGNLPERKDIVSSMFRGMNCDSSRGDHQLWDSPKRLSVKYQDIVDSKVSTHRRLIDNSLY